MKGGNRGAVVEPGAPEKSLLVRALRHEGDVKMPPGKKMDEAKIAAVEKWVKDGMAMPEKYRKGQAAGGGSLGVSSAEAGAAAGGEERAVGAECD
ncbi:MAG: hypothetical protein IPJ98_20220 [Bryobacterales bacterium]|nr:hypothetical protein [Bryobacterales bacterium]